MDFFSRDYRTARRRFRDQATRVGGTLVSLALAAQGPDRDALTIDPLTIDIAWFGSDSPRRAFVHTCGTHGVEGFAGSAIQLQWLAEGACDVPEGCAIVLVHGLNPYGMAWLRRANEHNVDLNRNCLAPEDRYEGAPPGYEGLDTFLNPPSPPAWEWFSARAARLILRYGLPTLKQTIAGGQYVNPKGLFFGGASLEEGPLLLKRFIEDRLADVERLIAVDVHTGLGSFGADTLLVSADEEAVRFATLHRTFGRRLSPSNPEQGPAYRIRGGYETLIRSALPKADTYFVVQEFGTYGSVRVLRALRDENRWHLHGKAGVDHRTKLELAEAFGPESGIWRQAVLKRGAVVIRQGLALLS